MKRLLFILAFLLLLTDSAFAVDAFPGAEGFGATSIGGRGGVVCQVTNLNDSGAGSFRQCVMMTVPRTVVFRVGGTITLTSQLEIETGTLTIAGQTAPGGGILIRTGQTISFGGETPINDVIVRYVRFRFDMTSGGANNDTLTFVGSRHIWDHCSISWGTDANFSAGLADNSTVQYCIISEGQTKGSEFSEGSHHLSVHHNLWAHHYERSPKMRGEAAFLGGNIPIFDFVNNVIYNWGNYATGLAGSGRHNAVNNYYKPGSNSSLAQAELTRMQDEGGREIYVGSASVSNALGNYGPSCLTLNCADQWQSVIGDTSGNRGDNTRTNTRHTAPAITTVTAAQAYNSVLATVGASFPSRDAVDNRIISNVTGGTGSILGDGDGTTETGEDPAVVFGWPTIATGTPYTDSDSDGMQDSWETSNFGGLSRTGTGDFDSDGFTDLEEFLAFLLPVPQAGGATRWIDITLSSDCTSGNYSIASRNCTGSDGNAYRTPTLAMPGTAPGDTVNIRAGTYSTGWNYQTTAFQQGTLGSPVIWQSYLAETVLVNAEVQMFDASVRYHQFKGNASDRSKFTFDLNKANGRGCFQMSGATMATGPANVLVQDLTCRDTDDAGILMRAQNNTIRNVDFINNADPEDSGVGGQDPAGHGIYLTQQNQGNIIEFCLMDDPGDYGIQHYDTTNTPNSGNIFRYNTIINVPNNLGYSQGGIISGADGNFIYGNLIYDFVASDVSTFGIEIRYNSPAGNRVYNNTILMGASGTGIFIDAASTNSIVQNNIVMGGGSRIVNSGSGTICSTNLTSDSAVAGCASAVDTAANTWTNSAADDFTLKQGSKAIGTGQNLTGTIQTLDIIGAGRQAPPAFWDLGAYKGPVTPTLTLIQPNGGTLGQTGSTQTFTWSFTDAASVPNVKLLYDAANDGTFETTLSATTANNGSFNFTAPAATTTGRFRVEDAVDASPFDVSDSNVTITAAAGGSITTIISDNTSGPKIGTIGGTTNALLAESAPDFNYGGSSGVRANKYAPGNHSHSVLKFPTSSIPTGVTVTAAEFGLYKTSGTSAFTIDIRNNKRAFVQGQATWNSYSTGNAWGTPGGLGAADRDSTVLCNMSISTDLGYYTCSSAGLTAWVQSLVNLGTVNNGAHLERNSPVNDATVGVFGSNSFPTAGSDQRPYLQITYTTTAPTITLTQPTTGGHYFPGQIVPIHWNSQGISGNVKILMSPDAGVTYTEIEDSYPYGQADFAWTVPPMQSSSQVIFKVESLNDPTVSDTSDQIRIGGRKTGFKQ